MIDFSNSLGIDTIRFIARSKTLQKHLDDRKLKVEDDSQNYLINQHFKDKEAKQHQDYRVQFIKIGNVKNLSGYILIKSNLESISISKGRKKAKDFYREVIFTGLRQPTKDISMDTYKALYEFIEKFKVSSMDVCFDGFNELNINSANFSLFTSIFKDYISSLKNTKMVKTSFYINSPISPIGATDNFKKIIFYDKHLKESRHQTLNIVPKHWKRLEATIQVGYKLKDFAIDDYLIDVLILANVCFDFKDFDHSYLMLQLKLMLDKRTHRALSITL